MEGGEGRRQFWIDDRVRTKERWRKGREWVRKGGWRKGRRKGPPPQHWRHKVPLKWGRPTVPHRGSMHLSRQFYHIGKPVSPGLDGTAGLGGAVCKPCWRALTRNYHPLHLGVWERSLVLWTSLTHHSHCWPEGDSYQELAHPETQDRGLLQLYMGQEPRSWCIHFFTLSVYRPKDRNLREKRPKTQTESGQHLTPLCTR